MQPDEPKSKRKILIVDDDDALLRIHVRALVNGGYEVHSAHDGSAAAREIDSTRFDAILSDIDMPGLNGIQLLERVRVRDLDVPVVLITGSPSVETAIRAMEQGALRYLVKPVELRTIVRVTDDAVRFHEIARAKRLALDLVGGFDRFVGDRAGLTASFERALETLYIAYQPLVTLSSKSIYAYEALLRSREPSLPFPDSVLDAAERLGRLHELGRAIRRKAVSPSVPLGDGALLFINLHPADLLDEDLFRSDSPLAALASRVVLEITERASLSDIRDVKSRILELRKLGFRIALDDLGAGYAGLTSFTLLEPDIAKLDMALVRNIDREPKKQMIVRTMISMCTELGIIVTAEGIETTEERDELTRAKCDLMQGYLFARPGDAFPIPQF